ncbi:hypothetical protein [Nocardioides sp. TF02-7]|uniref:hypothetical protein n=1 Tax=Nocardioides sp. TF02-7 TaxID=2917724 RepID=UPI001F06D82A|nr:hypothetical protein [Nocardioides sp. TF02-7]UMG91824.1 hypothetical protein MF408_17500 [Nocardioides sp. TF02-7]
MDLFVYVVVLNLAIQYLPRVISETFTLSLLTAVLLKASLEVVLVVKSTVRSRLHGATTRVGKVAFAAALWAVAAGSKLVVLRLIDVIFGGSVSLGGFASVTLLVLALLVSRAAVEAFALRPLNLMRAWNESATPNAGTSSPHVLRCV